MRDPNKTATATQEQVIPDLRSKELQEEFNDLLNDSEVYRP